MKPTPVLAYAHLNARIMPVARGERFEDPLIKALAGNGYGRVTGGGTQQSKTGEIDCCGIDVDLIDLDRGPLFVCGFLADLGAPRGSKLQFRHDGKAIELPFGLVEGVAIYLNGTDLPAQVYQQCDINVVIETINRLLGRRGMIQGHWHGPTESALYLYGTSAQEMQAIIAPFLREYPLRERARLVVIA